MLAINSITNTAVDYPDTNTEGTVSKSTQTSTTIPSASTKEGINVKTDAKVADDEQQTNEAKAKRIKSLVDSANNKINEGRKICEYTYHEDIGRISIKIKDATTDKVIKEIPPEETIKMIEKLWESAGIIVDEKR